MRASFRFVAPTRWLLAAACTLALSGGCTPDSDDPARRVNLDNEDPGFSDLMDPSDPSDPSDPDPNDPADPADPGDPNDPQVDPEPEPVDLCAEGPSKGLPSVGNFYYGTDTPEYLTTMTAGQMLAIGNYGFCTGTIITDEWVLSAEHCGISPGDQFCVGPNPGNPNICFTIVESYDHPGGADMTLSRLDVPYYQRAPDLEPLRILEEALHQGWIGEPAEAAGYGQQEDGSSDRREFTDEVIVEIDDDKISIDGQGQSGVCFGDSGGPVMVYDSAGTIRVAGALSWGDPSCVDVDHFTRVDLYYDWIVSLAGAPAPSGPVPCGTVSTLGSCDIPGGKATYCGADGNLVVDTCSGGDVCGYNQGEGGWRCMSAALDPCSGAGTFGSCNGGVLSWCTGEGVPQARDCGACGESCQLIDDDFGYTCKVSGCGGIDYQGECQGDVAVWCNNDDELSSQDCGASGKVCGWHSEDYGNWCVDAPVDPGSVPAEGDACGDINYQGACYGDTAVWCSQQGSIRTKDCTDDGETCGFVNNNIGYYCE